MSEDLKSCPFYCKGQASILDTPLVSGIHAVMCTKCCVEGPTSTTREGAVAAWNRRADTRIDDAVKAERAEWVDICQGPYVQFWCNDCELFTEDDEPKCDNCGGTNTDQATLIKSDDVQRHVDGLRARNTESVDSQGGG